MGKKICDLGKKEYEKKMPEDPKFTCKKCERITDKKGKVCKPEKL